jgi:hypothetical protein
MFVVSVFLACCCLSHGAPDQAERPSATTSTMSAAFVWQGWQYEWLNHILGFQTPHRLGSFASTFTNISIIERPSEQLVLDGVLQLALTVCV